MIELVSSTVYVGSIEGQEVRLQIHGETFPERKQHHDYVPEDVDVHRNIVLNTGVKTPITLPGRTSPVLANMEQYCRQY